MTNASPDQNPGSYQSRQSPPTRAASNASKQAQASLKERLKSSERASADFAKRAAEIKREREERAAEARGQSVEHTPGSAASAAGGLPSAEASLKRELEAALTDSASLQCLWMRAEVQLQQVHANRSPPDRSASASGNVAQRTCLPLQRHKMQSGCPDEDTSGTDDDSSSTSQLAHTLTPSQLMDALGNESVLELTEARRKRRERAAARRAREQNEETLLFCASYGNSLLSRTSKLKQLEQQQALLPSLCLSLSILVCVCLCHTCLLL